MQRTADWGHNSQTLPFPLSLLSSALLCMVPVGTRVGLSSPQTQSGQQSREATAERMKWTLGCILLDGDSACCPYMQQNPPVWETVRAIYQTLVEQT